MPLKSFQPRSSVSNVVKVIFALVSAASPILAQQYYPGAISVPRDQGEVERMEKDIDSRPIPQDPGLVYDDSKEARSMGEYYRSAQQAIPETLRRLEDNKKQFHQAVANIRDLAKDPRVCLTRDSQDRIGSSLKGLGGLLYVADASYTENPYILTQTEIERLYRLPSDAQLCKELAPSPNPIPLEVKYDGETSAIQKKLTDRRELYSQLQATWDSRLKKLNDALTQQKQAYDILKALPWIVILLCIFSTAVLFAVRFFSREIQLELVSSGQVIQFPTVMALLVVVVALGLPGILKENTLAALLGGIGGYVLSQGVGRAAAREGERRGRLAAEANESIQSLAVSPSNAILSVGGQQAFSAFGAASDGSKRDLTPVASWNISDGSIGTIENVGDGQVVLSASSKGKAVISASVNGMKGQASVIVT